MDGSEAELGNDSKGKHNKTATAVNEAMSIVSSGLNKQALAKRFGELIKLELEPNEQMLFGVRQSYMHDLTPKLIVATDRKLIIINPSFFYHYLGFNLLTPTVSELVHYARISHVACVRGRMLNSINLTVVGHGEVHIGGLSENSRKMLFTFIDRVAEALES